MTVIIKGSRYCTSPVASSKMTVSDIVILAIPPNPAAAPTKAKVPLSANVPRLKT
jgi:hypothetical protein